MPTDPFSLRMDKQTLDRLAAHARERNESKSRLAQRLIEEGLRMEAHPGVVFQDGPTGRRARLICGPDVWEVINVMRCFDGTAEEILEGTAESTGLHVRWVDAALR